MGRCSKSQSPERLDSSLERRRDELGYQFLIYALIELDSCQESLETGDAYAARINGSRAGLPRQKQSAEKWPTDTLHDPNRKRLVLEFPSPRLFLPFYSIRSKESGIRMPRYAKRNRERGRGRGRNLYLFDVESFKTSFPREYFFFLFLV